VKYKVIVFDFDDTLILSGKLKYDTFFEVFSEYGIEAKIIVDVLSEFPELNRYDTIAKITQRANLTLDNDYISESYTSLVNFKIINAKPLDFAEIILNSLMQSNTEIFLSSNTPVNILSEIVKNKNWDKYFIKLFGYPATKIESLKKIIKITGYTLDKYLVVGDGQSDKNSALMNCVEYFEIKTNSLLELKLHLDI
jgi:phosphoglycolate phosphatase-like HAD superfamily hydrolase